MKYNIPKYPIGHPFGEDMFNNINSVKHMVKDFISIASRNLEESKFVTLICMGSSGSIVGTMFYLAIQKKYKNIKISLCHVKKDGEDAHGDRISGFARSKTGKDLFIWVDDFIESGETVETCLEVIRNYCETKGIFFENIEFKFDYVVCSTIKCNVKTIEKMTKNIVYNYL